MFDRRRGSRRYPDPRQVAQNLLDDPRRSSPPPAPPGDPAASRAKKLAMRPRSSGASSSSSGKPIRCRRIARQLENRRQIRQRPLPTVPAGSGSARVARSAPAGPRAASSSAPIPASRNSESVLASAARKSRQACNRIEIFERAIPPAPRAPPAPPGLQAQELSGASPVRPWRAAPGRLPIGPAWSGAHRPMPAPPARQRLPCQTARNDSQSLRILFEERRGRIEEPAVGGGFHQPAGRHVLSVYRRTSSENIAEKNFRRPVTIGAPASFIQITNPRYDSGRSHPFSPIKKRPLSPSQSRVLKSQFLQSGIPRLYGQSSTPSNSAELKYRSPASGKNHDDRLALHRRLARDANRRRHGRAAGDPAKESLPRAPAAAPSRSTLRRRLCSMRSTIFRSSVSGINPAPMP